MGLQHATLLTGAALFLLAASCAGCLGASRGGHADATGPILVGGPRALQLSACVALQATAALPATLLASDADRPAGWPPADPARGPDVRVAALRCSRIGVGPFERGPVHLVLEWHGDAEAPAACRAGQVGGTETRILTTALVDDPDVAAYLAGTYGMPAHAAQVAEEETTLGPARLHTWTWSSGGAESHLRLQEDAATAPKVWQWRLFWPSGPGVARLDLALSGNGSALQRPAEGLFQPPFLLARTAGGAFAGAGTWSPDLDGQGAFALYRGLDCLEALP